MRNNSNSEETFHSNTNMRDSFSSKSIPNDPSNTDSSNYSSFNTTKSQPSPNQFTIRSDDNALNEEVKNEYINLISNNTEFLPAEYRTKINMLNKAVGIGSVLFANFAMYKIIKEYPILSPNTRNALFVCTGIWGFFIISLPGYYKKIYESSYNSLLLKHSAGDVKQMIEMYRKLHVERMKGMYAERNSNQPIAIEENKH
jgi:hypothetical protein